MISGASAGIFTSVLTLKMSLCQVDTSVWLPMPSISLMLRFVPLAPRYMSAPSPLLIPAVSAPLDVFEVSVWPVDPSAWPLNASAQPLNSSAQLPGPFASPVRIRMLPRHMCGIPPLSRFSSSIDMVTSSSDSFGVSAGSILQPASPSASSTLSLSLVPSLRPLDFTPAVSSATFDLLGPSAIEFFVSPLTHTSHSPTSGDPCVPGTFSHAFLSC